VDLGRLFFVAVAKRSRTDRAWQVLQTSLTMLVVTDVIRTPASLGQGNIYGSLQRLFRVFRGCCWRTLDRTTLPPSPICSSETPGRGGINRTTESISLASVALASDHYPSGRLFPPIGPFMVDPLARVAQRRPEARMGDDHPDREHQHGDGAK